MENSEPIDFKGLAHLIQVAGRNNVRKLVIRDIVIDFTHDTISTEGFSAPPTVEVVGDGENRVEFKTPPDEEPDLLINDPVAYEMRQMGS